MYFIYTQKCRSLPPFGLREALKIINTFQFCCVCCKYTSSTSSTVSNLMGVMHIYVHTVHANVCLCQGRRTTEHHIKNTFISHSIVLQCNDKQVAPFRCCLQQRSALSTLLYIYLTHMHANIHINSFCFFFFNFIIILKERILYSWHSQHSTHTHEHEIARICLLSFYKQSIHKFDVRFSVPLERPIHSTKNDCRQMRQSVMKHLYQHNILQCTLIGAYSVIVIYTFFFFRLRRLLSSILTYFDAYLHENKHVIYIQIVHIHTYTLIRRQTQAWELTEEKRYLQSIRFEALKHSILNGIRSYIYIYNTHTNAKQHTTHICTDTRVTLTQTTKRNETTDEIEEINLHIKKNHSHAFAYIHDKIYVCFYTNVGMKK